MLEERPLDNTVDERRSKRPLREPQARVCVLDQRLDAADGEDREAAHDDDVAVRRERGLRIIEAQHSGGIAAVLLLHCCGPGLRGDVIVLLITERCGELSAMYSRCRIIRLHKLTDDTAVDSR